MYQANDVEQSVRRSARNGKSKKKSNLEQGGNNFWRTIHAQIAADFQCQQFFAFQNVARETPCIFKSIHNHQS